MLVFSLHETAMCKQLLVYFVLYLTAVPTTEIFHVIPFYFLILFFVSILSKV